MGRLSRVLLFAFAAVSARTAHAQEEQDAASLVRRGVELRRQHQNEQALDVFKQAMAISKSAPVQAQIGLAEQALTRWLDAARDLDAALAADDPWIARNRAALEEARGVVEEHLAFLTVEVDVASSQIELEGETIPQATETRVAAGPATLVTRAEGYVPDAERLVLAPREHAHRRVVLIPIVAATPPSPAPAGPPAPPPPPAPLPEGRSAVAVAGPVVLGVLGVGGLAVGSYFGLRAIHEKNERDAQCVGGCTAPGLTYDANARTAATASTVAFPVGLAALAGGATWWLLSRPGAPAVSASVGPGVFVLSVRGAL